MKKFILVSMLGIVMSSISANSFFSLPKTSNVLDNDDSFLFTDSIHKKWPHGPLLINVTENYSYQTTMSYSAQNPNHLGIKPVYTDSNAVNDVNVNESCFYPYVEDASQNRVLLTPLNSVYSNPSMTTSGNTYLDIRYERHLPTRCKITPDSRSLGDVDPFFQLKSGASPNIGNGLLLYRTRTTNVFSKWDNYYSLDEFVNNIDLRIRFGSNANVQIAVIYEIDNYS